jgi:hypothetical protein
VTASPTAAGSGAGGAVPGYRLTVRAAHRRNPYQYLMNAQQFDELLADLGRRRAESIRHNHTADENRAPRGVYARASMGFVILDPTASAWLPDADAILGVIAVGDEGSAFIPNAAAKVVAHRRTSRDHGRAVLADPRPRSTGDVRVGACGEECGVIVGAGGQRARQNLYEAAALAADLVSVIAHLHRSWEALVGPGEWPPRTTPQPANVVS